MTTAKKTRRRQPFSRAVITKAKQNLADQVMKGDVKASLEVLERCIPKVRPITVEESLDGQAIDAKLYELLGMKEQLDRIEARQDED